MLQQSTSSLLNRTDHRPYPIESSPWALSMEWHDLLFMHWAVPADSIRSLIPEGLELDLFDGKAWLGVVPFDMRNVRPHLLPSVPWLSNFPELNLRTYVTTRDAERRPGVWFFSLDAHNPVAVRRARATFNLPYFDADMSCEVKGKSVHYRSERTHKGAQSANFVGRYQPVGESVEPNDLTHFLTERYCLYSANSMGEVRRGEIHHELWSLQPAELDLETSHSAMTEQIGVTLPRERPLLHFSKRLDVLAWLPHKVTAKR